MEVQKFYYNLKNPRRADWREGIVEKEDVFVIIWITTMIFILADLIDRNFLFKERLINKLIDKSKTKRRCVVCKRPMIVTPADGNEEN